MLTADLFSPSAPLLILRAVESTRRDDLDEAALEALQQPGHEPGCFRGRRVSVGIEATVTLWPDGPPEVDEETAANGSTKG